MSAFVRKPARSISFTDSDGRPAGKLRIGETGGRGNKHFNPRRPNGPQCNQPLPTGGCCAEQWKPVCPNLACPGNYEVRKVMRIEKYGRKRHERQARP